MTRNIHVSGSDRPALVDDEDFPVLVRITWHLDKNGYVLHDFRHGHSQGVKMHELLVPSKAGHEIQFIDRDPMNHQKANMTMVTRSRNVVMSRKSNKPMSSIYRGVHWNKHAKLWCSRAEKNGKTIYNGYFKDEKDAAVAYLEAVREHHGIDLTLEQITRRQDIAL